MRGDKHIVLSVCRHCLRVVAFAPSVDKLEVAEAAHVQHCHRPDRTSNHPEPLLAWNNRFSVKIATLDAQHARLVGMLNVLNESVARGEGKKVLALLLNGLLTYTKAHFAAEEALMAKHGYAGLASHRAEHAALTATVQRFKQEFDREQQDLSHELLQFLQQWLSNHILGTDRQYSGFLHDHGER